MNIRPMGTPADWLDSEVNWAETHTKIIEAELDRFIADRTPLPAGLCGTCRGECPAPQACQQPENVSGFPLEPLLARYQWLGPLLLALVGFAWLCLDGYLATPH